MVSDEWTPIGGVPFDTDTLWRACQRLPEDWEPYGSKPREDPVTRNWGADCSCGCRWFLALDLDWGVCLNPASHRAGLLTWEHQGCPAYDGGPDPDEDADDGEVAP